MPRSFGAGVSPTEMLALYSQETRDPLDLATKMSALEGAELVQAERARKLSEPSEAERAMHKEEMEQFRFTIGKYSEMIRDEKLSPTAREIYKGMLKNYVSIYPKEYQQAAGPVLAYSPIDPVAEGLDKFERLYPRPVPPQSQEQTGTNSWRGGEAPRDESNEFAWAQHDIGMSEWNMRRKMMQDQLAGIKPGAEEYKQPTLFPSSTPDRFYYKDRFTNQVGYVDMKHVPQGEFQTAIEKYGWSMPDFMRTGMYPIAPQQTETLGDSKYSVRLMRSVVDGKVIVDRIPLGAKETSEKAMDQRLQDALSVFNMKGDEDLLKDQTAAYAFQLLKEVGEKIGTPEGKSAVDKANAMFTNFFGYVIQPYDKTTEDTWRKHIPLLGGKLKQYTMKDGTMMAVGPVRKTPVPYVNAQGQMAMLYYSDAIGMALDARGLPVPETKDIPVPGEVTQPILAPNLTVEPRSNAKSPVLTRAAQEQAEVQKLLNSGWLPSPAQFVTWLISEHRLSPEQAAKLAEQAEKARGNPEKYKQLILKAFSVESEEAD